MVREKGMEGGRVGGMKGGRAGGSGMYGEEGREMEGGRE